MDVPGGPLAGKRVVLGVCGGIAAYKAVEVCRRLSDAGALVSPVLTRAATRFVGEVTFSALAAEPARVSLFGVDGQGSALAGPGDAGSPTSPVLHVSLGRRADAIVVVPATARLIGSYAAGISSDLLTSVLLATRARVLVCPAMHTEMWEHPAVQENVRILRGRGVQVLEPDEGRLAGGDVGKGRLPAPERIVASVAEMFVPAGAVGGPLAGVKAVVSAGGTREPLDPVRYFGNRSSGKQGYAIAAALAESGASVTLVTSSELAAPGSVDVVEVETAAQMADAVLSAAGSADVVVMAAAVADYRPAIATGAKLKKSGSPLTIELVPTLDILAELGTRRRAGQVLVGFAAETAPGGELGAAELGRLGRQKLEAKGADLIVANDVGVAGAGFGSDRSLAVIVAARSTMELGLVRKRTVATELVGAIIELLMANGVLGRKKGAGA